jgi:hypothetical protein
MSKLPDISDTDHMALVGRVTVLRKARREAARSLRDLLVPLLNSIENHDKSWNVDGVVELVNHINELNAAIEELG